MQSRTMNLGIEGLISHMASNIAHIIDCSRKPYLYLVFFNTPELGILSEGESSSPTMVTTFRLPYFRLFHLFRDRRQKTSRMLSFNILDPDRSPTNHINRKVNQDNIPYISVCFFLCDLENDPFLPFIKNTLLILQ